MGCFSDLHFQRAVHQAHWLEELDCQWKNWRMKNALALASGDLDSDSEKWEQLLSGANWRQLYEF